MNKKGFIIVAVAVLLIITISTQVTALYSQEFFNSLRNLSVEQLYDQHSSLIDLALYLVLFISLALVSLGKHLEGKHGKLVAVAVGMILSFGLVLTERRMGFNLRTFGPVAAVLIVCGIGLVIFLALKKLEMHAVTAACAAYILMFFTLQSMSPGLYDWIYKRTPWVTILMLVAMLVLIIKAARKLVPNKHLNKRTISDIPEPIEQQGRPLQQIRQERGKTKTLKALVNREHRDAKMMIAELKKVIKLVNSRAPAHQLVKHLQRVRFSEEDLIKRSYETKQLAEQLRSCDLHAYDDLRNHYQGTQLEKQRNILKSEIHGELNKMQAEERIAQYEKYIDELTRDVGNYLQIAVNHLKAQEGQTAVSIIDKAILRLKHIEQSTDDIRKLEKELEHLLRKEKHSAKKETALGKKAA